MNYTELDYLLSHVRGVLSSQLKDGLSHREGKSYVSDSLPSDGVCVNKVSLRGDDILLELNKLSNSHTGTCKRPIIPLDCVSTTQLGDILFQMNEDQVSGARSTSELVREMTSTVSSVMESMFAEKLRSIGGTYDYLAKDIGGLSLNVFSRFSSSGLGVCLEIISDVFIDDEGGVVFHSKSSSLDYPFRSLLLDSLWYIFSKTFDD